MPAFLPPARKKRRRKKEPGGLVASLYLRSGYGVWGPLGGGGGGGGGGGSDRSHLLVFFVLPLTSEGHKRRQLKNIEKWNHMH